MKKAITILLISIAAKTFSQVPAPPPPPPGPPDPPKKEKVEAMRIGFLTQKLDLSPEEAQKFWPVYNEFQKKRDELFKQKREQHKNMKENIDSLSDKQVEAMVDAEMAFRQKNLDLEKEYHAKFKAVLPIKKVAKLYHAEEMFTQHLLQQISDKKKDHVHEGKKKDMKNPPPPPDPKEEH